MPATRGLKKDSDRAVTPVVEAVRVPTLLAPPGSPASQAAAPPSCPTLTGAELPQAMKGLASMYAGSLQPCPVLRPCRLWPARLLCSGKGVLQARMLEHTGLHWLPCPSRPLYFLLPCPPTPLSTWCCQNPCDPAATPPPHLALTGANPSPPGQPQEQTPVDDPHAEVEIKPQLKPRGSVTKQEGQKPSHQLHKLQIKSTSSIRPTLCLWNI